MSDIEKTSDYFSWIGELKKRYRATQIKAAISVNSALLEFYWNLGKDISERYPGKRRNAHFFAELSADLKIAIPEASGLSERNLQHIQRFYEFYSYAKQVVSRKEGESVSNQKGIISDEKLKDVIQCSADDKPSQFAAELIMQVPWGHHIVIMSKCGDDVEKALFYVRKTVENGWSRNVLSIEIDGDLYSRQGRAVTNFALTMPDPDSELAQQLTKDPYIFDVQGLAEKFHETELTKAMCENIVRLLNSMGRC